MSSTRELNPKTRLVWWSEDQVQVQTGSAKCSWWPFRYVLTQSLHFQRRFEVTPNHKNVSLQEYEKNLASLRRERDELKKQNQQQAESIADLNRSV